MLSKAITRGTLISRSTFSANQLQFDVLQHLNKREKVNFFAFIVRDIIGQADNIYIKVIHTLSASLSFSLSLFPCPDIGVLYTASLHPLRYLL